MSFLMSLYNIIDTRTVVFNINKNLTQRTIFYNVKRTLREALPLDGRRLGKFLIKGMIR